MSDFAALSDRMDLENDHDLELYLDCSPDTGSMTEDVREGLSASPPFLPSKYFYDARGSALFDRICELDEYYPTRTEMGILTHHFEDIDAALGGRTVLIEYGSGSSTKTRLLLENLSGLEAYVPIDISREHLIATGKQLKKDLPDLRILPVCADYGQEIPLSLQDLNGLGDPSIRRIVFFPGSTIGNFTQDHAIAFLSRMQRLVGASGGVLIGVDLIKERSVLHAAYNDQEGVTAAFNRNILDHLNERLGSTFNPEDFEHRAFFDEAASRIEMRLVARRDSSALLPWGSFSIAENEYIRTEYSHKYSRESFERMARQAGLEVEAIWTDEKNWFSVQLLRSIGR